MAEITLTHVKKVYDKTVVAVQDFNMEIQDKEFIVLVGPSGCGKSTTLRMIAGLEEISEGEIAIGGKVVNRVPLSHYLYGVVAYEMSNSFPLEALKAQAVAAKNYAEAPEIPKTGHRSEGAGSGRDFGYFGSAQAKAQGSVRRPAAACGHWPCNRPFPQGVPDG